MAVSIDIDQTDLEFSRTFMREYLQGHLPEADFSDGTGLQDLVLKAMSYYFAFLRSELQKVKTLRSLSRLSQLDSDEEVSQAIDDIISNFFITRGQGSKSRAVITLTFSQRVDVFVGTLVKFNRDGEHIFFPIQDYSIAKENLIEVNTAAGVTTYETDITVEAEDVGTGYDIPAGNFTSFDKFNPYITAVRNEDKGSGGDEIESDAEYIERSNSAITVRNLINPRSARTVLLEKFKDIGLKDVTAIGYGDPEMLRDQITTNVSFDITDSVHIGNHQDIYVQLPLIEFQKLTGTTATISKLGEPDRTGAIPLPQSPVYKIHSVVDTDTQLELAYHLFIRDHTVHYTKEQESYIIINTWENGVNVEVTYDTVTGFDQIHNFLIDPDERTILANTLARAKVPIYVSMDIPYVQNTGSSQLDETAATNTVISLIARTTTIDKLSVDDIEKELHTVYGDQIFIQTPLLIKGTVYYPDGTTLEFFSENVLDLPEYLALGMTNRVCGYFSSKEHITFTKQE